MTPLEELQAAYKRLSELRHPGTAWTARKTDAEVMAGPYLVANTTDDQYTDLIVALHRTIDAQLQMLARGIAHSQVSDNADYLAILLARAINGGTE